jgi:primosomal protein N' (replication factor Y)
MIEEKLSLSKQSVFVRVIINLPSRSIDQPYDYQLPEQLLPKTKCGSAVIVPFGRQKCLGFVISFPNKPAVTEVLNVEEVIGDELIINQDLIELAKWLSEYYAASLGESFSQVAPPNLPKKIRRLIQVTPHFDINTLTPKQQQVYQTVIKKGGKVFLSQLKKIFGRNIYTLVKILVNKKAIKIAYHIDKPAGKAIVKKYVKLTLPLPKVETIMRQLHRAPKQKRILSLLRSKPLWSMATLLNVAKANPSSINSLVSKGIVRIVHLRVARKPRQFLSAEEEKVSTLTSEQYQAINKIKNSLAASEFRVFLLEGVTGSGKTEIYLRATAQALKQGKSVIVLVPEIALTAQMVARFKNRFGDYIAVWHSGLSPTERFDQWFGVREGKYRVVIGARSAIFAPAKNLGLIIIDEEHEPTFKQGKSPRYHAREVAIVRAKLTRACLILGSATPSLESIFKRDRGEFEGLWLRRRVVPGKRPKIILVDMRQEGRRNAVLSRVLQENLLETLNRGGKALLFLNRRGFANFLMCHDCGHVPRCQYCAVSLTYHRTTSQLLCHHCGFSQKATDICPLCSSPRFYTFGLGTQKVELELRRIASDIPVIRMDADTTKSKDAQAKFLALFQQTERCILLGTQMIAKGLHFPEINLVGVINADTALHLPDFRAAERTFQLLAQVTGRAGRGYKPGIAVIQTYSPEAYPIQAVLSNNFTEFYRVEMQSRRQLAYPPFVTLIRLLLTGNDLDMVRQAAVNLKTSLENSHLPDIKTVLGPSPAPISKIKGHFRWHILLKTSGVLYISQFLKDNIEGILPRTLRKRVLITIDVEPQTVL